uniref:Reverse transcriptase domain-containing protein n=1 Tax=Tanacetum cinerariifolium TaxID=118510 RepID=A0A6L2K722_TANCI|nr:reverse transcriptase domain-containing protein [Tanacetum cinerariifolium]
MKELLQAPTEGDVHNDVIKLMMFPYSLEGNAIVWMNTTSRKNASKTDDRIDKLADQISTLVDIFAKKVVTPASIKAVEEFYVTCGGPLAHYNCLNTDSNQPSVCVATGTYNQVAPQNRASNYMAPPGFAPVQNSRNSDARHKLPEKLGDPGKFLILRDFPGIDVCHALADLGTSIKLMPLSIWKKLSLPEFTPTRMTLELADRSITYPKGVAEDVFIKVGKFYFLTDFVVVDFEADPRTMRYSSTYDDLSVNRIDIIDVSREEYAQEILGFSNNSSGGNPTSTSKPIISDSSHSLTPFKGSVDKLPVIIEKDLKDNEKEALLKILKSHKMIARPMTHLLDKETPFVFSKDCIDAFVTFNKKLIEASILVVPEWNLPFELMYDASDFVIGAVLGQQKTKHFQPIHYACKTMTEAKLHYTTARKKCLPKQDAKPKFIWWFILLQEFDIIICDKKGTENLAVDHLSRLENPHKDMFENKDINENFTLETLGNISSGSTPWYILVADDYLSKWVEAKALPTNDARVVVKFLKSLFARYRTSRAIISDRVTHFCNDKFAKVMSKYGVTHRLATAYHPQKSRQVEVSNRGLKRILKGWLEKTVPHENKAYWALKHVNFDLKTAGDHQKIQLNELNELRDQSYENSLIYKEKTKKLRDSKIKNRIFNVGDWALLFNSHLKIFSGKFKTRWLGPFTITKVFPYGTVELSQPDGPIFNVNGHRVKHYFGGDVS